MGRELPAVLRLIGMNVESLRQTSQQCLPRDSVLLTFIRARQLVEGTYSCYPMFRLCSKEERNDNRGLSLICPQEFRRMRL